MNAARPVRIDVQERCSHVAAGEEAAGRVDVPCVWKPGNREWTLKFFLCAICGAGARQHTPEFLAEVQAAVGRANPFDAQVAATRLLDAQAELYEAAEKFAETDNLARAQAMHAAAVNFTEARKIAGPLSATN